MGKYFASKSSDQQFAIPNKKEKENQFMLPLAKNEHKMKEVGEWMFPGLYKAMGTHKNFILIF